MNGLPMEYEQKKQLLLELIEQYCQNDIVVAFSGGADSSLLLKLACEAANKTKTIVHAVTIQSELQPKKDLEVAKEVAQQAGARHHILSVCELEKVQDNPKERCYICKKYLFKQLKQFASKMGVTVIIEGTNKDDLSAYRPGIRAIRELGIQSPLSAACMTKREVRMLAREYGISVADRPSTPCLATRFPYGTRLDLESIKKVEQAENYLHQLGFFNVRVRVYQDIARIEVDQEDIGTVVMQREEVVRHLKAIGYSYITVDLEGFRSGSMDKNL